VARVRKPLLIAAAVVVVIAAAAALIWRPWEKSATYLTDLVASDIRGYRVEGNDLVQGALVQGSEVGEGSVSYDLGARFTTFEGSVSLRGRPAGSTIQVQITLDGTVEYEAEVVAGDPPRPVKLTVAGARKIILSGREPASLATELVWTEPRLT